MPDYLLLEAGGKLLLEGGGSLLLESGGAGGATDPHPRHLAHRLVALDPAAEFVRGIVLRAPLPPTGEQPLRQSGRITFADLDPRPFDGRIRRAPLPPTGAQPLRQSGRLVCEPDPRRPFDGTVLRAPIPPTGAQYEVLHWRRARDPDPPRPFDGFVLRAPIPPTGQTAAPALPLPRIVLADLDPRPFGGSVHRAPLPPSGLASPGVQLSRVVRPADVDRPRFEGTVRRAPRSPFHTGSDTTPTPVDSIRPHPRHVADLDPAPFPGAVRRAPVPPTGQDAPGAPFLRRTAGLDPADARSDERTAFEGRVLRTPRFPFPTGSTSAAPRPHRLVLPAELHRPLPPEPFYLGLVRRSRARAGDPAWPGLLARRIVLAPDSAHPAPAPARIVRRSPFATGLSAATSRLAVGPPFLGGLRFSSMRWLGPHALQVDFVHSRDDLCVQLYAGRTLIGHTTDPADVRLVAHLVPSAWPQPLQLVAVEPAEVLTDYGSLLPLRAYNRVRLDWTSAGMPSDTRLIEIAAGTAAGGAVDTTNVLDRVRFDRDRAYVWRSRPLAGSGTWNFEVAARDDRPGDGNRGTALALSATVLSAPPDVRLDSSGRRLVVAVASQTATVTFLEPE